jgi:hypothetical protein
MKTKIIAEGKPGFVKTKNFTTGEKEAAIALTREIREEGGIAWYEASYGENLTTGRRVFSLHGYRVTFIKAEALPAP